ncbi:MAG: hypothetical protein KatS3mg092_0884 [Patescibacteria group bacterium]|nr:MAG: hypothetical protein KatS3mg092_0884 [Patescibacteria group bacterium]
MGCYGIGTTRLLGTIVEVYNDEKGIIWPTNVAPYQIHLIGLDLKNEKIAFFAKEIYEKLSKEGLEVLFDDRVETSAGEKLKDADLIGIPTRLIISKKTGDKIEYKKRNSSKIQLLSFDQVLSLLRTEP